MKHTTIKQTLTTLCILITLTLSAQVIDRFPHVESFEGSAESTSWEVCHESNCIPMLGMYPFVITEDPNLSNDGSFFLESHTYTNNSQTYSAMSSVYDFSCLDQTEFSFYFIAGNNKLQLEYSTDGSSWNNIWTSSNSNNWQLENLEINFLAGMSYIIFRFVATGPSSIDFIKVGKPGNTINLSFGYDASGNRTNASLIVSLQGSEVIENRMDESDAETITQQINVFPNPTADFITVSVASDKPAQIKILNKLGKLIKEDDFIFEYKFGFENLPNDSYLVQIEIEGIKTTYKVIKVR